MGNGQTKESRPESRGHTRSSSARNPTSPTATGPSGSGHERSGSGIGGNTERDPAMEPRRETKAEREARKLEKERVLRAQERERSIREEGVDGGFLVTLGTYTGPEDFSKPTVRQLQIERRVAPFWKGLNDHSDTWTEHQLVAVVNGLPLPAPDEIPPEEPPRPAAHLSPNWNPRSSDSNINSLTVPIGSRTMSQNSDRSANLSPSHPAFSLPSPTSPIANSTSSSPFFRGRAKTLAALSTGSRNNSQTEMTPQEIQLPKDPYVNGQRVEVYLYKNAEECPICFLYYPPYLNKTRCCDQPICSECFVQIKRPDPHPPEHHDDPNNPPAEPQEDNMLVSEPAACPFCVQPEFGVTYEPPPFRRGLAYANQNVVNAASAMSSSTSVNSQGITSPGRRRATSLAVNDKTVITTDQVRPDWAKKLADARAHALRRAAAATALHNAAYMMGNIQQDTRGFGLGRRRRTMFGGDSAGSSGQGTPQREGDQSTSGRPEGQNDLPPGRHSSRRGNRIEDLEELMMMEAIRLSLAAEEERKRKEERDAAKEAKKEEKRKAKELKKVVKAQKNIGSGFHPIDVEGMDESIAGSSSAAGKGKAVDRSTGSASEASSTANASTSKDDPQKHLEESRAHIQRETSNTGTPAISINPSGDQSHRSALRNLSNASSSASSFAESLQGSNRQDGDFGASNSSYDPSPNVSGVNLSRDEETPPQGSLSTEPMFNFRSLAQIITVQEGKDDNNATQHIEDVETPQDGPEVSSESKKKEVVEDSNFFNPSDEPESSTTNATEPLQSLEESVNTIKPTASVEDEDEIKAVPPVEVVSKSEPHIDQKHIGDVSMVGIGNHQTTQ